MFFIKSFVKNNDLLYSMYKSVKNFFYASMETQLFSYICRLIEIHNIKSILDVGCGDKKWTYRLKDCYKDCDIVTLDAWPNFEPDVLHDLNNLPLPFSDDSFDLVLLLDVIEHLDKKNGFKLLEYLKRICKIIILLTPLWWQDNLDNVTDSSTMYFNNSYNLHKSLWSSEDFKDFKRLEIGVKQNYYIGVYSRVD